MTTIGTHPNIFHSDEIIAVILVGYVDSVTVTRTRDEKILKTMDMLIDVGGVYAPLDAKYDHHQFKKTDPFYGLSSAGLVWRDVKEYMATEYEDLTDLEAFIDAVDRRDTRVEYDPSNVYEPVFDAITACNGIDPRSTEQNFRFNMMVELIGNIVVNLATKNIEGYTDTLEVLETLAEKSTAEKLPQYAQRQLDTVDLGHVVVSKFFPEWRKTSKFTGKPFIMPGDNDGEYKVMIDTTTAQIAATRDEVFTHTNGFISIVKPKESSTHIGIALTNGALFEIPLADIKKVIG